MRKFLKSFLLGLLIALSFGGVAHAEQPLPLAQNDQIIQQQSNEVGQKTTLLLNTSQEIQGLEQKKQTLTDQLQTEQKTIEDLKHRSLQTKRQQQKPNRSVLTTSRTCLCMLFAMRVVQGEIYTLPDSVRGMLRTVVLIYPTT